MTQNIFLALNMKQYSFYGSLQLLQSVAYLFQKQKRHLNNIYVFRGMFNMFCCNIQLRSNISEPLLYKSCCVQKCLFMLDHIKLVICHIQMANYKSYVCIYLFIASNQKRPPMLYLIKLAIISFSFKSLRSIMHSTSQTCYHFFLDS